jgi:hypothetical protein
MSQETRDSHWREIGDRDVISTFPKGAAGGIDKKRSDCGGRWEEESGGNVAVFVIECAMWI